jgi:monoamine oxidase
MRTSLISTLKRMVNAAIQLHYNPKNISEHIALLQHAKQIEQARKIEAAALRQSQNKTDQTLTSYLAQTARAGYSRRRFLSQAAQAAVAVGMGSLFTTACSSTKKGQTAPRIAIIGAGIAGLNAAYHLQKAGYRAQVYEASKRTGGRMFSGKNLMGDGLTTEIGAEFIDSWHSDMLDLAQTFNLEVFDALEDMNKDKLNPELFLFSGQKYSEANAIAEIMPVVAKLIAHTKELPDTINYQTMGKAKAFDLISIEEYFGKIGINGWLKELFNVAFTGEYGLEIGEQSALNFLTLFDPNMENGKFSLFGDSDERYKIKGGNQQITDQLTNKLQNQISYEYTLEAIKNNTSDGYVLSFSNGKTVNADVVVLAIPFTILRQIDLQIALPAIKKRAIDNLGYGTNSKLFIGTNNRLWREQGQAGFLYSNQIHTGWDNSQGQNGNKGTGAYTVFLGGQAGYDLAKEKAAQFHGSLDLAFEGFSQSLNNKTEAFNWAKYKHSQGSYSCYRIGQWTTIGGAEALPVGNLLFAGEHCSSVSAGFMNGGAESGRMAAEQIMAMLNGVI